MTSHRHSSLTTTSQIYTRCSTTELPALGLLRWFVLHLLIWVPPMGDHSGTSMSRSCDRLQIPTLPPNLAHLAQTGTTEGRDVRIPTRIYDESRGPAAVWCDPQ